MKISTEQYERILHFLDADMTLEEMDAFEKELAANPAIRQQLDFEQSIRDGFNLSGQQETVLHNMEVNAKHAFVNPAIPEAAKINWLPAAAAAILVMIASWLFIILLNQKSTPSPTANNIDTVQVIKKDSLSVTKNTNSDSLKQMALISGNIFKKYYHKESVPEEYPIFLAEAFEGYASNNYKALEKLDLEKLPQTRDTKEAQTKETILLLGNFYKGIAALENGRTDYAIKHFTWVIAKSKDAGWKQKGHWYLAMSYLQEGNIKSANEQLNQIEGKDKFGIKAKEILKTINSK